MSRKKGQRISKIRRQPKEAREKLDALIAQGTCTVDELHEAALDMGMQVSRGTVWRYSRNYATLAAEMEKSSAIARAMLATMQDFDSAGMTRVILSALTSVIFERIVGSREEGKELSANEVRGMVSQAVELARAVRLMPPAMESADQQATESSDFVRAFLDAKDHAARQLQASSAAAENADKTVQHGASKKSEGAQA